MRTNGWGVHLAANGLAGFGALVFLAVPGIEFNPALQMVVLLAGYLMTYAAIVWLFFGVGLCEKSVH